MRKAGALILLCGTASLLSLETLAYPSFNRLGYVSCSACHHLPTGGGPLTAYGLGVSDELSAIAPLVEQDTEAPPRAIDTLLQSRALMHSTPRETSAFLMQADASASAALTERIRADATLGLGLERGEDGAFATVASGSNAWVLRRALASYALSDMLVVQAGRDKLPLGLNLPDHTAFVRTHQRRGPLDYPTQARAFVSTGPLALTPFVFAPSFEESTDNREWGGGLRAEIALDETNAVGAAFLTGATPAISRDSLGAFARLSFDEWNGLLAEYARVGRTLESGTSFAQDLVYLRPFIVLPAWLETGFTLEYARSQEPFVFETLRLGPGIRARALTGLTLSLELRNVLAQGRENEWTTTGQVFLWL